MTAKTGVESRALVNDTWPFRRDGRRRGSVLSALARDARIREPRRARERECEVRRDAAGEQHLPQRERQLWAHPDEPWRLESVRDACRAQLSRLQEQMQNVHVRRRVQHEPIDAL